MSPVNSPLARSLRQEAERHPSNRETPPRGWRFIERSVNRDAACCIYKAATEDDFAAVDRLWNTVYGREFAWLMPADGPRHKDRYDAHSVYLLARAEGRAVGTMRLVRDSAEGLPIEQFIAISDLRDGKRLIECQRLMVLAEYRNRRWPELPYGVFGGLIKAGLHWCITNDYSHILADLFLSTKTTPLTALRSLGFEETGKEFVDTELAEPGRSVALLLRVGELFSRPFRMDSPGYRYLMEYDESVRVYD
jgi:hypothetical protein